MHFLAHLFRRKDRGKPQFRN